MHLALLIPSQAAKFFAVSHGLGEMSWHLDYDSRHLATQHGEIEGGGRRNSSMKRGRALDFEAGLSRFAYLLGQAIYWFGSMICPWPTVWEFGLRSIVERGIRPGAYFRVC